MWQLSRRLVSYKKAPHLYVVDVHMSQPLSHVLPFGNAFFCTLAPHATLALITAWNGLMRWGRSRSGELVKSDVAKHKLASSAT